MPSVRIRLEIDPKTSKRTVVIAYESDSDALPHEHEEAHRALVQKLFEGRIAREGDAIKVEREGAGEAAAPAPRGLGRERGADAERGAPGDEERREGERKAIKEGS